MSLLEVQKLSAFYGDFQALFDIDFRAEAGKATAIIGANGAGKSTFLRAIAGFQSPAPDAIRFDGEPIGALKPSQVVGRGVALVPEGRRLFPSLNVEENLRIGAYCGRTGAWTLKRVYELFPVLQERRDTPATALSGGQQQMVALGRALMGNPRLLMCDEISLGLAPVIIKDIYAALPTILSEGVSVILVEQDIGQALSVAEDVYCFQGGRVSLAGKASDLSRDAISAAYFGV
jgi:branched-chain amino acid transport system ATP-binding protein